MKHRPDGREVLLNTPEDVLWLRQTHLKDVPTPMFKSAVMFGNEDCPTRLILYHSSNPLIHFKPVAEYRYINGEYERVT